MSLILSNKYTGPGSYQLFLTNRLLRLFPTYLAVFVLCILFSLASHFILNKWFFLGTWITYWKDMKPLSVFYMLFSNLAIVGQDLCFFTELAPSGSMAFSTDALFAPIPMWIFLIVPQAWTLNLEIMFYLLAPFLVRRRFPLLFALIMFSAVLRVFFEATTLPYDPWRMRFFPAEFCFFLLGILSHRIYRGLDRIRLSRRLENMIIAFYFACLFFYQYLPANKLKETFIFGLSVLVIPLLFARTKHNRLDRTIGELSYPMYISQFFTIAMVQFYWGMHQYALVSLIVTTLLSIGLNEVVMKPVERYRQKRLYATL